MTETPTPPVAQRATAAPWLTIAAILALAVLCLRLEGRRWWCECATPRVWISDVWSSHCSQHLLDPYSLTHLSHGLIFCGMFALLCPRLAAAWRLAASVAIAAGWEVLENSAWIINKYRTETMSLNYLGDSIVNSTGDILCAAAGFMVARRLGLWPTVALFVAMELLLLWWIRDNLTINVIMLIHPVQAIKGWQSVGQPAP